MLVTGIWWLRLAFPLWAGPSYEISAFPDLPPLCLVDADTFPAANRDDMHPPTCDPSFSKKRWPCIIRGAAWGRRLEGAPLSPKANDLIPLLKQAFAAEGLPVQLAWVAEVESTWNTNAVSRSGALGLFQFKEDSARRFSLLHDSGDLRTVPEASARAAARYLSELYCRLGDWRLAVAAYNAGEGCVTRLLKSRKAKVYEEIAAELPPQTQVYVIKVMATLLRRENACLSALPGPFTPSGN